MDMINQATAITKGVGTEDRMYWVQMAESLDRLENSEDFKRVITNGYFKDKAVMGVSLLANDQMKKAGVRPDIMEGLIAISALEDHFKTIRMMGQNTEDDFEEDDSEGEV